MILNFPLQMNSNCYLKLNQLNNLYLLMNWQFPIYNSIPNCHKGVLKIDPYQKLKKLNKLRTH